MTQKNDRYNELMAQLNQGILELTSSEKWVQWLRTVDRFHAYSFNNTLLIALQRPDATRVAGFRAWQQMGRQVRKGEKAIRILAPVTKKADPVDREVNADSPDTKGRVLVAFRPACVFDIMQTDGEDLVEVCHRLTGDAPEGIYEQLVSVAQSIGYRVEDHDFPGVTNGDCSFDLRRIRVHLGNRPSQRVKTIAHELAHAVLHEGYRDRAVAELEAESVAFIVTQALGLDSSDYSFGYVATWAGGGGEAVAAIKASGQRIQRTADDIIRRLEGQAETSAADLQVA